MQLNSKRLVRKAMNLAFVDIDELNGKKKRLVDNWNSPIFFRKQLDINEIFFSLLNNENNY